MPAALITPVLIGAAVGAVGAAIQGGNILKGALFGALGGAVGGAISAAFGGAAGSAGGAAGGAVEGAATSAATGGAAGAVPSAVGPLTNLLPGAAAEGAAGAAAGEAAGAVGAAAGDAVGTGLSVASGGSGLAAQAPTSMAGFGNIADTGLSFNTPGNLYGGGATTLAEQASGSKTFLSSIFKSGQDMLNSRLGTSMIGETLKGYAAGKAQEAQLEARKQETLDARANARFGNIGSRYNTASMMGPAVYKA